MIENMPTVLITGGAGFFGGVLARLLLERTYRCISIDVQTHDYCHSNLIPVKADIRDSASVSAILKQYEPEAIFHCAALMSTGREGHAELWSSNVDGTRNMAELAKQAGIRHFIFISSNTLWTENLGRPIREDDPPAPVEIYGKSKVEGERILEKFAGQMKVTVLRCPAIIDRGRLGLLSILFEFIEEGRKIWVLGGGSNRYQWIYGRDAAEACVRLLETGKEGIFHSGADHPLPLREIYQHVIDGARSSSRIVSFPKAPAVLALKAAYRLGLSPFPPYFYKMIAEDFEFDTSKLRQATGWQPTMTNEEMLLEAYNDYRQNQAEIVARRDASVHRRPARMGIIRLLKWLS